MAKAVERGENWFGYYWSPTSMIGKYKMHKLDFGVPFGGKDNWDNCIVKPEKECANPKKSSWVKSEVNSVVSANFKKNAGVALDYITNRIYPGEIMNGMLVFMTEQKASGKDAAFEFLEKHGSVWEKWVSADVAKKVKAGL